MYQASTASRIESKFGNTQSSWTTLTQSEDDNRGKTEVKMEVYPYQPPKIAGRERVMEGADIRVQILMLAENENIRWHYHSEIADPFICLEGSIVDESRAPRR